MTGSKKYLWLVIGTALFFFSNGNLAVPLAAWLAPLFLIRYLRQEKWFIGLPVFFVLCTACTYFMLYGLSIMSLIFTFYFSAVWFLPYVADRLLHNRVRGFAATLVFPSFFVALEYLSSLWFGSWGSTAYAQYGNLPIMQLASVTGIWGLTFLVTWFATVANWAWEKDFSVKSLRFTAAVYAPFFLAALFYGGVRLAVFADAGKTVPAATIIGQEAVASYRATLEQHGYDSSASAMAYDFDLFNHASADLLNSLLKGSRAAADAGAKIIVLPESVVSIPESNEAGLLASISQLAKQETVYLAMGYFVFPEDYPEKPALNKTALVIPDGTVAWDYRKSFPIPVANELPGDKIVPTINTEFGRLGSVICYDMEFSGLVHQAGAKGVDLMLVPAWDWAEITPLHSNMAVFRAVENGFSLIRSNGEGLTIVSDCYGRVLASHNSFVSDASVMLFHVPTKGASTLYSVIGDLLAYLCVGCASFLTVLGLVPRSR